MTDLDELPNAPEIITTATQEPQSSSSTSNEKRKQPPKTQTTSEFSIRRPDWTYIQLQHIAPSSKSNNSSSDTHPLDGLTAHLHLTAALSSFLGVHGTAIPIDITKLEGREVWIRVPAEDRAAVIAAAGGWISGSGESWRVRGWSHWCADACGRDGGQDLFEN